jgi:predicted transcriptional regulator of viral defense system
MATPAGISSRNRAQLEELHRRAGGAFSVAQAAELLGVDRVRAARLLGYLARRGWLSRVRRGLYVAVPLDARQSGEWIEDPWVVADQVFSPCYIGGWSACEHWDLTEQTFRAVLVVTAKKVREREVEMQGISFHLTVRTEEALFGTVQVWRGQTRVAVSDPSRTIVDVLDNPRLGGGIRTVVDVLREYMASQHRDDQILIAYGDRLDNRAVFKRLGYLIELLGIEADELLAACRERRSAGLVALDPSVKARGQIVRRWGLRANVHLAELGDVA